MSKFWKSILGAAIACLSLTAPSAFAYDFSAIGHVTRIEPTYLPSSLNFSIDVPAGTCAAGVTLTWNIRGSDEASQIANSTAVYTALVTALAAGRTVTVYGNNSNCSIDFIQIS